MEHPKIRYSGGKSYEQCKSWYGVNDIREILCLELLEIRCAMPLTHCTSLLSYLSVRVTVWVVVALVPEVIRGVAVAPVSAVAGVVVAPVVPSPALHPRPLHPLLG